MTSKPVRRSKDAINTSILANQSYRHQEPNNGKSTHKQELDLRQNGPTWCLLIIVMLLSAALVVRILTIGNASLDVSAVAFASLVVREILQKIPPIIK